MFIEKNQWANAAKHYAGTGLENGADARSARALLMKLKKKGKRETAGARMALFAGGAWPRQRRADCGLEIEGAMCPRCGEEPETRKHRMWKRKCHDILEACQKSKHLESRAPGQIETEPRLWLRGALPKSWTAVRPPPEPGEGLREEFGDPNGMGGEEWPVAAGGASGGESTQDPRLRRVARGWVTLRTCDQGKPTACAGARGALAGRRQSVNRGELMATKECLKSARRFRKVKYIAGSSYAMRGAQRPKSGRMPKFTPSLNKLALISGCKPRES